MHHGGGGILAYSKSFANFNTHKEFNIIQGKIPNKNNGDVTLAVKLDGEKYKEVGFPSKEGHVFKGYECTNGVELTWKPENWKALIETDKPTVCILEFETKQDLLSLANVGDYIKITPSKTLYKTDKSMTGYNEEQTINPSELSMWRIIRKNENGTIDIVSEYVSSTALYFSGEVGYQNYVGYLNILAKQYENDKYTVGSRYIGYNGQTEFITVPINDTYSGTIITNKEPGKKSDTEAYGGGDTLYNIDTDLVENVYGTLSGNKVNSDVAAKYFLASRNRNYFGSTCQSWEGRIIDKEITLAPLYSISLLCGGRDGGWDHSATLRPILTLKGDISPISGDGKTLSTAWTFE